MLFSLDSKKDGKLLLHSFVLTIRLTLTEKLQLNFESHNLVELLQKASQKEAFSVGDKTISFSASEEQIDYPIDVFHFENAINNIVDNAIKYGGGDISGLELTRGSFL